METSQISPESWAEVEFNCKKSPIFATGRNAEKCAKELRLAKSESNLERMNAKKKHYFHDSKFPFSSKPTTFKLGSFHICKEN